MSDPPRQPLVPLYTGPPEIHYDNQGNRWVRDRDGNFVPYHEPQRAQQAGPTPQGPQVSQATLDARANGAPSQPIEQAFEFSLRPVQGGFQHPIPIDPALQTPLPRGPYLDLTHARTIADAKGLKRGDKVAGSRRNGKGKERADGPKKGPRVHRASSGSDDDEPPAKRAKGGRPAGSTSYGKAELQHLFSCVEDALPIGAKGWKEAEHQYNKWAKAKGYAVRPPKAIENKFKGYVRQKKPTGDAECPPEVKHAHELESLMNERVGTRELSDAESQSDGDSSDVEVTAVARRAPSPPLKRKSRASGGDLVAKLSAAFDPDAQRSRDDARAHRSSENTQILTLTQQVRDAQALSESLRTQNTVLQGRLHDVERQLDRVTVRADIMTEFAQRGDQFSQRSEPQRGRTRRPSAPPRPRREPVRCEHIYADGGAMTYWLSDSTDDYDENENPFEPSPFHPFPVPRKSRSRSRNSRAVSRRRTPTPGVMNRGFHNPFISFPTTPIFHTTTELQRNIPEYSWIHSATDPE
ncbi:hypothetical protein C8F04DRAFT_1264398 [Mycena alexandri]|uniref:DUF6818 domain-containing protein n=1 Tax=Mycena alexandri TaxID=1745969 RepID=A0AAD6SMS2_9AGAR|nr:hypothetical protein C8F04DRAFT_1264398 [Mycena alexandri]